MEKVNHEFLAELAKSNSPVLNSKPQMWIPAKPDYKD